ncbi:DUF4047 domain-containing protein [Chryseobacterium sp. Y16C]|uniref:DUF4047 domain-containing protein n=1 Tax=Chryseobacterium sp. Y16C TaxID=2920939 RepID=UPI001F0C206F|nr:DUF4047 domain-containing protein [Chryseobacterium sp. Y16C]UMQ44012.1 DUF4047 domain-containing protein [Chryseobacterium sp. Y16C]
MRTKILLLFLLGWVGMVFGQEVYDVQKEIDSLKEKYNQSKTKIHTLEKEFEILKGELTATVSEDLNIKIKNTQEKIQEEKKSFKNTYQLVESYKNVLENTKKKNKDTVDIFAFFKEEDKSCFPEAVKSEKMETKTYLYFGENKIIDQDLFANKKSTETELLKSLLLNVGKESYLGDITIPKAGQKFLFYNSGMDICPNQSYSFQKLKVEIKDGYFSDIVVYVADDSGDVHVFTNQVGLSILFYSQYGSRRFMYYLYSVRKEDFTNKNLANRYTDEAMEDLLIKVTDVMGYSYKIGNHYIPQDLAIELPQDDVEGKKTNSKSGATYQIKQDTYLEKIVELRAYTDFLALFGQSQNGLAQIEGKAKFYLFPYPFRFFGSKRVMGQLEVIPSVSPFVNYSKFDDKSKYVNLNTIADYRFELVEKRFLTMGLHLETLKWQHKNSPVSISLYGIVDYNLTQTNLGTEEQPDEVTIKALKYGGGIHVNVKRFNNFGFNYKFEYSGFNYLDFNGEAKLEDENKKSKLPSWIPVVKHEAEIFYHPNGNPNQAIFTRLITYNDAGNSYNQAFYQFQFGYKFSIGSRTVKQVSE